MTRLLAAVAALSLLAAGAASAQTDKMGPATGARTAPMKPTAPTKPMAASKPTAKPTPSLAAGGNTTGHSAAAVECSKEADAKGLHGKAREKFRSSCKTAAKG